MKKNVLLSILVIIFPLLLIGQKADVTTATGISQERLTHIDNFVTQRINDQKVAGAVVLIARNGEIAYHNAYGQLDKGTGVEMPKDGIFEIMSMTKPVTAVAIMQLYEAGKLQLSDKVSKYIPEFANMKVGVVNDSGQVVLEDMKNEITIHHLLTHTSGLAYGFMAGGPLGDEWKKFSASGFKTNEEMCANIVKAPLMHQPGTKYTYGRSFGVLGRVVEVISGMTLGEYMEQHIFEPLGMEDTGFDLPDSKLDRLTSLHVPDEKTGKLISARAFQAYKGGEQTMEYGGGGLLSTAADYNKFCQMLLNNGKAPNGKRLLSRKTVELMTADHTGELTRNDWDGYYYGLGVSVHHDKGASKLNGSLGEYNWSGLYNTHFWIDPQEKLVGIILSQVYPYGYPQLNKQFKILVYQSIDD